VAGSVIYTLILVNGDETIVRAFRDAGARDAALIIMALDRWILTRPGDRGKWTLEATINDPGGFVGDTSDYEVYFVTDSAKLEGAS
jgi:hypothetical protein